MEANMNAGQIILFKANGSWHSWLIADGDPDNVYVDEARALLREIEGEP